MFLSAKAEYACLALLELAARYEDPKPIRLADMADRHDIPQRFLVQILLQLKAAGLVTTVRGASGGYQLTRQPDRISLADILSVLGRSEPPVERASTPSPLGNALTNVFKRINTAREKILQETTLAELLQSGQPSDYVI